MSNSRPLVVIFPGMGMEARYYRPIAEALTEAGFPTTVGELRGQGESPHVASRSNQWGYHHVAAEDYPATISNAKQEHGLDENHPVILLTHSMGGQVGTLFMARPEASALNVIGMLGVGAGNPWHKAFPLRDQFKFGIGIQLIWLVSQVLGYYDAAMQRITVPVVLTRFKNDRDCTYASAQFLADQVAGATVEELDGGLGHNRWAREPEIIVGRVLEFAQELQ